MWEIWVRSREGSPSSKDLKVFLLFSRKEEEEVVTLPSPLFFLHLLLALFVFFSFPEITADDSSPFPGKTLFGKKKQENEWVEN